MLTPETIQPAQLRELRSQAYEVGDREMVAICCHALRGVLAAIETCCAAINFGADYPLRPTPACPLDFAAELKFGNG